MQNFVIRISQPMTLEQVSKKYNMSLDRLMSINNLRVQDCYVGMRLLIEQRNGVEYIVQPFDTLDKIASDFGVDKAEIKKYNRINQVFLGQKLFIPTE
ncbi:MAG: LysM peptidoglycan-binding domain-containing protein [Christensenellales bacterium]